LPFDTADLGLAWVIVDEIVQVERTPIDVTGRVHTHNLFETRGYLNDALYNRVHSSYIISNIALDLYVSTDTYPKMLPSVPTAVSTLSVKM
jgi:hypothetical protein